MSQIIEDLKLDLPPVTLWLAQFGKYRNRLGYIAECNCGWKSRPARLISAVMAESFDHGVDEHTDDAWPVSA